MLQNVLPAQGSQPDLPFLFDQIEKIEETSSSMHVTTTEDQSNNMSAREVSFEDKPITSSPSRKLKHSQSLKRTRPCLLSIVSDQDSSEDTLTQPRMPLSISTPTNGGYEYGDYGQFIDVIPPDNELQDENTESTTYIPHVLYKPKKRRKLSFDPTQHMRGLQRQGFSSRIRRGSAPPNIYFFGKEDVNHNELSRHIPPESAGLEVALDHMHIHE